MTNYSFRIGLVLIPLLAATAAFAEVRVSSQEAMKAAVQKVPPEYSGIAKQMKILGRVEVEASISENGDVEAAKAISGNPLLTASAVTAVKKWKFTPFQENGAAAKAVAILIFEFK
jgi:TonB family protein